MSCILPPNAGVEPGLSWFRVCGHGWFAVCSEKKQQVNAAVAKMLMVVLGCPCPQLLPAVDLCGSVSPSPEPLQGYRMLLGRGEMQQGAPPPHHHHLFLQCPFVFCSQKHGCGTGQTAACPKERFAALLLPAGHSAHRQHGQENRSGLTSSHLFFIMLCYSNINNKVCGHCRGQRARC